MIRVENEHWRFRIRREEGVVASAVNLHPRGRGLQVLDRDGGLTYFDLSTASADFEAWLWVHGWSVNDMAIFKVKLGSVIGTHNAITHERTLRKRAAKVRARVGHGKETACATDQKNGYALNHRSGWFVLD